MPIYRFECVCGHAIELMLCIGSNKRPRCGNSCGKQMKKVLSPTRGIVKNPAVPRRTK